jgi:hypothetical protein
MKILKNGRIAIGIGIAILVFAVVILVFFILRLSEWYSISSIDSKIKIIDTGSVGDFIGGVVGTLLTFGTVIFLILAYYQQGKAYYEQKEQFILQQDELKERFQTQQFENKFFQLLDVQQKILSNIKVDNHDYTKGEPVTSDHYAIGLDAFKQIHLRLKSQYQHLLTLNKPLKGTKFDVENAMALLAVYLVNTDLEKYNRPNNLAIRAYSNIFDDYHSQIGHYFRHLYHILLFLHQSYINELANSNQVNKEEVFKKYKQYSDLLQAQMNSYQLGLLFYNGLCFVKTKKLLHIFSFLENLALEDLLAKEHALLYSEMVIENVTYKKINFKSRGILRKITVNP